MTSNWMVFITFSVTVVVVFIVSSSVIIKGKLIPVNAMTTQGGGEVQFHVFFTSVLNGREWSASRVGII